ncbi:endo-1,3(4)-beta-glucanase-like protein [Rhodofomes roseus]|uniref:Endo-1,3(4)-beta-glucanase-like protein n=1 Tax=Rhodofomes roseus TaxID=34475 RepID=A0ABQ8KGL2_9APHY|nr:endo-1,3(4)-beta-glucanase-like protein [Rhodofomes roseus]KAH9836567.1 endo-1,3(4)-beta-glucanase-like protein [Rhodofomes roseus]
MQFTLSVFVISALALETLGGTWTIGDTYVGQDFLNSWSFEAEADPTGGRVTYVDQTTALNDNLTYVSSDTLIMRVDDTTVLSSSDGGRNSVRIKSNTAYDYHVVVIDVRHMPEGCATWPAFWETNDGNWPAGGEVDIVSVTPSMIEGVNSVSPNLVSLHVGSTCSMPSSRDESGTPQSNDCDVNTDGNSGCGVQNPTTNSFGPDFNSAGGGWYTMERTSSEVKVWFWSRTDGSVPSDVSSGASTVNTDNWGTPAAYFPNTSCDLSSVFSSNNIIFDITLCGDWAGQSSVYSSAGCSGTCVDYVNANPGGFSNAYWDVASVHVYTTETSSS